MCVPWCQRTNLHCLVYCDLFLVKRLGGREANWGICWPKLIRFINHWIHWFPLIKAVYTRPLFLRRGDVGWENFGDHQKKLPRWFCFAPVFMAVEGGGEIKVSTNIAGWKIHLMLIIFARKDGDFSRLCLAEGIVSQYITTWYQRFVWICLAISQLYHGSCRKIGLEVLVFDSPIEWNMQVKKDGAINKPIGSIFFGTWKPEPFALKINKSVGICTINTWILYTYCFYIYIVFLHVYIYTVFPGCCC